MSSFEEDMREIRREVRELVLLHINTTPGLHVEFTGMAGKEVKAAVYTYAEDNDNEFGQVFQTELDALNRNDWAYIARELE